MNRFAHFYKIIVLSAAVFFFIAPFVFAETDINIQTNTGDNTICQNGVCTTTGNTNKGHATACINGHCETSDNGNLHMHEGNNRIDEQSGGSNISVTTSPEATEGAVSEEPSETPNPTTMQMRKDIDKQVQKQADELKEHLKNQESAFSSFFQSEMEALQKFFTGLFK